MNKHSSKLVVFDLDGTLVDGEGIDTLARAAGSEDEVAEVTERAMRGELDFGDSLRQRVAHLEGLTVEEADEALSTLELTDGTEEVVRRIDAEVAIFSGGFYRIANRVAERLGADHVRANRLVTDDGVLTGDVEGELVDDHKGEVLRELASEIGVDTEDVVAVGDGSNDVPMFEVAGYSVGFDPKPVAEDAADEVVDERDMRLVEPVLESKKVIKNGRSRN